VMTIIQGANLYVEQKIANLGTNVFQITRLPTASTDFALIIKALRYKRITPEDARAVAAQCPHCDQVGASASNNTRVRYRDRELEDVTLTGQTANMAGIDTTQVVHGRYFTDPEESHSAYVCVIGAKLADEFFAGEDPLGRVIRVGPDEFTVVGVYERIGSILGRERDAFLVIPMTTYTKVRGSRFSVNMHVRASGGGVAFESAQDEARLVLRARRGRTGTQEDDFFISTASTYISLYQSISSAFFAVFLMVSAISSVVGGIVIMNVMLVSVVERTKEIGVRRALGATQDDIRRQFLAESLVQCVIGGAFGILAGFGAALALRSATDFPASVQTWVAMLGLGISSAIGLFFGIYPATRAARLDPVAALRSE
jgi:putative ABC transport system permease protein